MKWLLALAAIGVALACAAGCTHPLIPASALRTPSPPTAKLPVLGVDLYARRSYPLMVIRRDGHRDLAYIRHVLGAQSVGIVWNLYSPARTSAKVARTAISLSPAAVAALTRQAQALGMTVEYRPLVRVGPRWTWEGMISPADERAWFASLFSAERPYLRLAQQLHVQEFVVATELRLLSRSAAWPSFLSRARSVYHGTVSYAAYQGNYFSAPSALPSASQYGVDPYPHVRLGPTASVKQLVTAWDRFFRKIPAQIRTATAMQEVGIPALAGAYQRPEKWAMRGTPDQLVQARWFTAACEVAAQYHMRGIYFYEVNLTDNPAHPQRFAAFFEGKLGAQAIHDCLRIFRSSHAA